jgi:hypothetical protein
VTGAARRRWTVLRSIIATALVAGSVGVFPAAASAAVRLDGGLRISADATYTIDGAAGVVHVTIDFSLTNVTPNRTTSTTITRYFFDNFRLPIPGEAGNVAITSNGGSLTPRVSEDQDGYFQVVEVSFSRLWYQETRNLQVTFDILGAAPRSEENFTRVNPAFVSFFAWAYGDPGRGKVTIAGPPGLKLDFVGPRPRATVDEDGNVAWVADEIEDPASWVVSVTGYDNAQLAAADITAGGSPIRVRYWPGDEEWRDRVSAAMEAGVPALVEYTGLDWPVSGTLLVRETVAPNLFGYAGWYLPAEDQIEMGEMLDEHVIVHETAHAWFNTDLFDSRWINEGLADTAAAHVLAGAFDEEIAPEPVRASRARVALNAWTDPDFADEDNDEVEEFGYNASWFVVDAIVGEIGPEGLQAVLAAARADEIAYVGAGEPESVDPVDDWRRFLDLVEEVGGAEGATELFDDHVIEAADRDAFEARLEAREEFQALVEAGGGWAVPALIRMPMADWEFSVASVAIDEAEAALAARDTVIAAAAGFGLKPGPAMEQAYESSDWSLNRAVAIAEAEQEALTALAAAEARAAAERHSYVERGLRDEDPEADLRAAREAFESGDLAAVAAHAEAAVAALDHADEKGRRSFIAVVIPTALAVGLAAAMLVLLMVRLVRRRSRERRAAMVEVAAPVPEPDPEPLAVDVARGEAGGAEPPELG